MACDASVVYWLDTQKGEPLSIGRKSRTIPPAIRRALQRRDGRALRTTAMGVSADVCIPFGYVL